MSGGHFRAEDVAARTLSTVLVWGFGVVGVALAGGWVGARYAAALSAAGGGAPNLAGGVLLVTVHLPAGAFAHAARAREAWSAWWVLLVSLAVNGVGVFVLAGLSPAPRCLEAWLAAAAGWCLAWSLTTATWAWGWRKTVGGWVKRGGFVVFVVGCIVSAWLYARGPFAVLPAEIGGGRPVEERVILDGEGFVADVVRLGDGWRVIIASDCATLGGREPARPLVLHRPARPVAAPDAPESSRREGRGGDV